MSCLPQKANKGQSRAIERLKKKMFENEFLLLLNSPTIPFRIHNRNGKVRRRRVEGYLFQGSPLSEASGTDPWESGSDAGTPTSQAATALAPRHALRANKNLLPSAGHHWHCRCHSCVLQGQPHPRCLLDPLRGLSEKRL